MLDATVNANSPPTYSCTNCAQTCRQLSCTTHNQLVRRRLQQTLGGPAIQTLVVRYTLFLVSFAFAKPCGRSIRFWWIRSG